MYFLLVMIVASISLFAQMNAVDKKKISDLNSKITECQVKIDAYDLEFLSLVDYSTEIQKLESEADSLNASFPKTEYAKNIKKNALRENETLKTKLLKRQAKYDLAKSKRTDRDQLVLDVRIYETQKKQLFANYISDKTIPTELSRYKENRLLRDIEVIKANRIENTEATYAELDIKKLNSQTVLADSVKGYQGIVQNLSVRSRIKFDVFRVDNKGKQSERAVASYMTYPGYRKNMFLLPGKYMVIMYREGERLDEHIFSVTAQKYDYMGEQTHWFLLREGY